MACWACRVSGRTGPDAEPGAQRPDWDGPVRTPLPSAPCTLPSLSPTLADLRGLVDGSRGMIASRASVVDWGSSPDGCRHRSRGRRGLPARTRFRRARPAAPVLASRPLARRGTRESRPEPPLADDPHRRMHDYAVEDDESPRPRPGGPDARIRAETPSAGRGDLAEGIVGSARQCGAGISLSFGLPGVMRTGFGGTRHVESRRLVSRRTC
jgi:hypothetical protein